MTEQVKLDYNSKVFKVNILYHNTSEISLFTGGLRLETEFLISLLQIIAIDILLGGGTQNCGVEVKSYVNSTYKVQKEPKRTLLSFAFDSLKGGKNSV